MLNMTKTYESPHRSTYPRLATAFKSSTASNREPFLDYISITRIYNELQKPEYATLAIYPNMQSNSMD